MFCDAAAQKKKERKMAEEDEIDILGDFSFNSCLAQNNQGIPVYEDRNNWKFVVSRYQDILSTPRPKMLECFRPSCSDREDTVHPQWLLDSVSTNWYDTQTKARIIEGPSRRLTGNSSEEKFYEESHTMWSSKEREILTREMSKYGRNVRKISQTLKTKTEAEIQALIEAEYGIRLETPSFGLEKDGDNEETPIVAQEEIVTDEVTDILNIITTGTPTVSVPNVPFRKKTRNTKPTPKVLRPDILTDKKHKDLETNPEIFYEDDMIIGLTESVGTVSDVLETSPQKCAKLEKEKVKAMKKMGNHRRKVSKNYDRGKRNTKDVMKSPVGRQRNSVSEDSAKSSKMQIVFSSGQALPVSEGEQVIKIEKNASEPESDIEIDVDSDNEDRGTKKSAEDKVLKEEPTLRKLQPMPKRQKKITLSGDGGYTIMHTEAGDLYEIRAEPRKERAPKKAPIHLIQCRLYNAERPAPYSVHMHVSCLISMDVHAHTSRAEVMGLAGGRLLPPALTVARYRPARAAAGGTHCDMDPVSQALAAQQLQRLGARVVSWHHSHPAFPPAPSRTDLLTQRALQRALERDLPLLGLITSQHWAVGRAASQYRCIRVEDSDEEDTPIGYQFSVKLLPDLETSNLPQFVAELRDILLGLDRTEHSVDMVKDVCPQAGMSYLEKCISSMSHLMRSAGYEDNDPVTQQLVQGVRDVFR